MDRLNLIAASIAKRKHEQMVTNTKAKLLAEN